MVPFKDGTGHERCWKHADRNKTMTKYQSDILFYSTVARKQYFSLKV